MSTGVILPEPPHHASIRYLGQVGVAIRVGGMTVAIDPYLTYSVDHLPGSAPGFWTRNYPPPILAHQMTGIDLVLCTHDHIDHADPETLLGIASASPACQFAGPLVTVQAMIQMGIAAQRTTVLKEGTPHRLGDLTVRPVAAAHETYETDSQGHDRYLGFLLYWSGLHIFHAGDTLLTERLVASLLPHPLHVAFLPINGRDDHRHSLGLLGNMDGGEAMQLALRLAAGAGLDLVVPAHYDLYTPNGASLRQFVEAWESAPLPRPRIKCFLPGEQIHYAF